ncbi:MAG: heavy-metal-associated domain-containing protein [Halobacteriota archaeon]
MSTFITVEGMSCGGCERRVEEALQNVEGVTEATADRVTDKATVDGDVDPSGLIEAVESAGYAASV